MERALRGTPHWLPSPPGSRTRFTFLPTRRGGCGLRNRPYDVDNSASEVGAPCRRVSKFAGPVPSGFRQLERPGDQPAAGQYRLKGMVAAVRRAERLRHENRTFIEFPWKRTPPGTRVGWPRGLIGCCAGARRSLQIVGLL